jgi:hypothetical protein
VSALIAAEPREIKDLILDRRDEILDDAEACLAVVETIDLLDHRSGVESAVGLLRDGEQRQVRGAQALATSEFTAALHLHFREVHLRKITRKLNGIDVDNSTVFEWRRVALYLAAGRAMRQFHFFDATQPDGFNRHASAHLGSAPQYNEFNAIVAVMLATAFLRELEHESAAGDDEN